jgi:hypothetical protein
MSHGAFWRRAAVLPLSIALLVGGCSPDRVGAPSTFVPRLVIVQGDGTEARAGDTIPVVVRLERNENSPLPNRIINWVVTKGAGSVWVGTTQTNAQGESRNYWIVGPEVGEQRLELRDVDPTSGERRIYGLVTATVPQPTAAEISTLTGWDGGRQIGMFGSAAAGTVYGQSFRVPTQAPRLNSFSFWLNEGGGFQPSILFNAYVMAWDGSKATGEILWKSGTLSGPTSFMQRYDFNVGIRLTPGVQYIAFLSTIEQLGSFPSDAQVLMGYGLNPYPDGRFYFIANATSLSLLTSGAWSTDGGGDFDAAFVATFAGP